MKGKKLSGYAIAFIFFMLGVAATLIILTAANRAESMHEDYDSINPADLNADFGR